MMMDSRSRLNYALFQLTPTRTRCDLVICAGDCKEKLASGLLEPFVAHLKYAKDEISKGGYSITLSSATSWFTKSTLERFVRFVSTPEVLERFITIEREIVNIERSINTHVLSDSQTVYGLDEQLNKPSAFGYKHESNTSDAVHEEDSKVHLQHALETRKVFLQREQAMVYARALVAGFETDKLEDLICFADAFGSPRLREACLTFMELCNRKSNDRVWMDEVAAMQAYSGSQHSYMGTSGGMVEYDPRQELRINVQNGMMHTYQGGPMFQPPYQGYPFAGMVVPPYYQGNLSWPPNVKGSISREKRSQKKGSEDDNFDSSDSSSGSNSGSYTNTSSRKVVIRNIYINSMGDGDEDEERESDVNQDLDKTVGDKHEGAQVTQQWDMFQNLLMKNANEKESNKEVTNRCNGVDPLIENKKHVRNLSTSEKEFVSRKFEDPEIIPFGNCCEFSTKHVESTKDIFVNDSLAISSQSVNKSSDSQLRAQDIFMVSESSILTQKKVEAKCVNEPNDLYLVLVRDNSGQQAKDAWTPEIESGNYDKIIELDSAIDKKLPVHGKEAKPRTKPLVGKDLQRKDSAIEAKSKSLVGSRNKKTTTKTTIPKGRLHKEEEKRKKMEELLAQRQKRIAERSSSDFKPAEIKKPTGKLGSRVISSPTINRLSAAHVVNPKVIPSELKPGNRTTKVTIKKNGESNPGSKTMKVTVKKNSESKLAIKPTKGTTKDNGGSHTSFSQRIAGEEKNKVKPNKAKPLDKNINSMKSNGPKKMANSNNAKQLPKAAPIKKLGNVVPRVELSTCAQSDNTKGVNKTLHKASPVHQKDVAHSDGIGGTASKAIKSVSFGVNKNIDGAKENPIIKINPEIFVVNVSTPPPGNSSPEKSNYRKKWSNVETRTKVLSGFRKLLSFGKRS